MTTLTPNYMRQSDFFDPARTPNAAATFVGCGGIGSFAAFATAKLGVPNITLIDPDHVEAHNLPSQMYVPEQADEYKVGALGQRIHDETGTEATTHVASIGADGWEYDYDTEIGNLRGVVVSGFDNMLARSALWHNCIRMQRRVPLYIDGRLDGQTIVIYAVKPTDMRSVEAYEATLYSDEDAQVGLCTARAIIDVGFMVGALISRMVRKYYAGEDDKIHPITVVNMDTLHITRGEWT